MTKAIYTRIILAIEETAEAGHYYLTITTKGGRQYKTWCEYIEGHDEFIEMYLENNNFVFIPYSEIESVTY